MATTSAKAATPAKDDKTLAKSLRQVDASLDNANDFIDLVKTASTKAPLVKRLAELKKQSKAAGEMTDKAKATRELAALQKDANAFVDEASYASRCDMYVKPYQELRAKTSGLMAQAMVEVGVLEPARLRAPAQAEQASMRAAVDKIEKMDVVPAIDAYKDMLPRIETFLGKQMKLMTAASSWVRGTYEPLVKRVTAAVGKIPADRARKTLLAEMDFVEADSHKAMAVANILVMQKQSVPRLQAIEKLAARLVASSPSVDRELTRIGASLQGRADGVKQVRQLKALAQAKAKGWPAGADVEAMESELNRFEADLVRLAAEVKALPVATATA